MTSGWQTAFETGALLHMWQHLEEGEEKRD
jgi:hypothetical protein